MEEKRKKEVKEMSENIGHHDDVEPGSILGEIDKHLKPSGVPAELLRDKPIIEEDPGDDFKKLVIPKCEIEPINGRILVIEISGKTLKAKSGLYLPYRLGVQKDDSAYSPNRYFAVAWDNIDIPLKLVEKLKVGKELIPFLPEEATQWSLPRVIDWNTGNVFKSIHYTELAGLSKEDPIEVEK
jgi:hypothetical protein